MNIPEKFYVKRYPENCNIVNKLFNKLLDKKYTGSGMTHRENHNFMHYPAVNNHTYSKRVVLNNPQKGYVEISVQQLIKFVELMTQKLDKLPNQWYVIVTQDNIETLSKWRFGEKSLSKLEVGKSVGMARDLRREGKFEKAHNPGNNVECFNNFEITYADFLRLELGLSSNIKGYIAKSEDCRKKIVSLACPHFTESVEAGMNIVKAKYNVDFRINSDLYNLLSELELLDLWCEPVYEEIKIELPVIKGYSGQYIKDKNIIKYGCAELPVEWFRALKLETNRKVTSINLDSNVKIKSQDIVKINNFLDYETNISE